MELYDRQIRSQMLGSPMENFAVATERYSVGYIDWRQAIVAADIAQAEAKLALASRRMRVCQACGFSREAYSDKVNLTPETCGMCD